MIREVTYYQVICDGCGADAHEGSDYAAWSDIEGAEECAEFDGWDVVHTEQSGRKHYCPDCPPVEDADR